MRNIASFSSLSYNNTFDESTSHGMDLVTITELYGMDKRTKPPKQIQDLVNRCMLFRISAKTEHLSKIDSAFPIFKINTDQQLLKHHCPEILRILEEEVNTEMLSLEDDEILETVLFLTLGFFDGLLNGCIILEAKGGPMIGSTFNSGAQKEKAYYNGAHKESQPVMKHKRITYKCSQPVECENFPLSDVTNVQQSKGNYSQRLYDSSFSGVTSPEQGHTFITPTAKRSSAFTKDIDTQDREFVRLPLSDVTNG
nr:replication factor A protein 1-like [Ipomoea batatas]